MSLLEVRGLEVAFENEEGEDLVVVDGVDLSLKPGQTLGLVGESGCGKSVSALSLLRLLPQPTGKILNGSILWKGNDLLTMSNDEIRSIRGKEIGMVFQEPMNALNPAHTIGRQVDEVFLTHQGLDRKQARVHTLKMLEKVGIPEPSIRANEYPHQLSGGMRQRIVIAIALACEPDLIIADEPTTALDVTIQAQVLQLMSKLQEQSGASLLLITHDLGVVAQTCDEVAVMYAGRIVERAPMRRLFEFPQHAYTRGLLASIPSLTGPVQTELPVIPGMIPALADLSSGCRFAPRSPYAHEQEWLDVRAPLVEIEDNHWVEDCPACRRLNSEALS
jgi:oligopeptide/dipeptide ABC transporter ATP-binding protein